MRSENQTSQVRNVLLSMYGECLESGSLKSFHWCIYPLSGAVSCVSHSGSSGLTILVAAVWWQAAWFGRYSFCLVPQTSYTAASLHLDDCDIACLLIWQEDVHSAPHRAAVRVNWDDFSILQNLAVSRKTLINTGYSYTSMLFDIFQRGLISYDMYNDFERPESRLSVTGLKNIVGNFLENILTCVTVGAKMCCSMVVFIQWKHRTSSGRQRHQLILRGNSKQTSRVIQKFCNKGSR